MKVARGRGVFMITVRNSPTWWSKFLISLWQIWERRLNLWVCVGINVFIISDNKEYRFIHVCWTYSAFTYGARVLFPALSVRALTCVTVSAVSLAQTGFKSLNLQEIRGQKHGLGSSLLPSINSVTCCSHVWQKHNFLRPNMALPVPPNKHGWRRWDYSNVCRSRHIPASVNLWLSSACQRRSPGSRCLRVQWFFLRSQ